MQYQCWLLLSFPHTALYCIPALTAVLKSAGLQNTNSNLTLNFLTAAARATGGAELCNQAGQVPSSPDLSWQNFFVATRNQEAEPDLSLALSNTLKADLLIYSPAEGQQLQGHQGTTAGPPGDHCSVLGSLDLTELQMNTSLHCAAAGKTGQDLPWSSSTPGAALLPLLDCSWNVLFRRNQGWVSPPASHWPQDEGGHGCGGQAWLVLHYFSVYSHLTPCPCFQSQWVHGCPSTARCLWSPTNPSSTALGKGRGPWGGSSRWRKHSPAISCTLLGTVTNPPAPVGETMLQLLIWARKSQPQLNRVFQPPESQGLWCKPRSVWPCHRAGDWPWLVSSSQRLSGVTTNSCGLETSPPCTYCPTERRGKEK